MQKLKQIQVSYEKSSQLYILIEVTAIGFVHKAIEWKVKAHFKFVSFLM